MKNLVSESRVYPKLMSEYGHLLNASITDHTLILYVNPDYKFTHDGDYLNFLYECSLTKRRSSLTLGTDTHFEYMSPYVKRKRFDNMLDYQLNRYFGNVKLSAIQYLNSINTTSFLE